MKTILKTFLGLVGASLAATSILTVSAFAAADGINRQSNFNGLTQSGNMWIGKFPKTDVAGYSDTFSEPSSFALRVNGDSLTMTGKYPYKYNYKWTAIILTSDSGTKTSYKTGTSEQISPSASYSGTLYSGQYYSNMYDGTVDGSPVKEKATVYVYMPGYMPSSNIEEEVTE